MSQRRRESSSPRWTALNNQGEGIGRKTGLEGGVREEEEKESESSQLDFVMDKARCTAGEKKKDRGTGEVDTPSFSRNRVGRGRTVAYGVQFQSLQG